VRTDLVPRDVLLAEVGGLKQAVTFQPLAGPEVAVVERMRPRGTDGAAGFRSAAPGASFAAARTMLVDAAFPLPPALVTALPRALAFALALPFAFGLA